jgi:RNA polymerase sigma factor (sigma-70 family)
MSFVCSQVGTLKPYAVTEERQRELLTLDEYQTIARKLICRHARSLAYHMLKSEDAIAHVVEYLIKADIRWSPDNGCSRLSYRGKVGVWAIKRYRSNLMSENKKAEKQFGDIQQTDTSAKSPVRLLIEREEQSINPNMLRLMDKAHLTEVQRFCIICRYYGGLTLQQIGEECGVERQRIEQIIRKALLRLKKWANPE